MPQYLFTEHSKQDLIQIRHFTVEQWGYEQSIHYLRDLRKTLLLLSKMPAMGKDCFNDLGENIYRFPYGSHIIYYLTTQNKKIIVIAILHHSMVPEKHLSSRL